MKTFNKIERLLDEYIKKAKYWRKVVEDFDGLKSVKISLQVNKIWHIFKYFKDSKIVYYSIENGFDNRLYERNIKITNFNKKVIDKLFEDCDYIFSREKKDINKNNIKELFSKLERDNRLNVKKYFVRDNEKQLVFANKENKRQGLVFDFKGDTLSIRVSNKTSEYLIKNERYVEEEYIDKLFEFFIEN